MSQTDLESPRGSSSLDQEVPVSGFSVNEYTKNCEIFEDMER